MNTQQELQQAFADYQRTLPGAGHGLVEIQHTVLKDVLPFTQMEPSKEEVNFVK